MDQNDTTIFIHGDKVILINHVYGTRVMGTLHLPDITMYASGESTPTRQRQKVHGHRYNLYTIITSSGYMFRDEGYLLPQH